MGYAVLATLLCCAAVGTLAGPQVSSGPDFNAPLRFTAAGTFQISIFEDLHFGENYWDSWGPQQDVNSVRVLNEVLDRENPQLVVLNGDLITGENAFRDNSTAVIHQIAAPLVQRNLSWASTYGNHDSQFNLSRAQILATEHEYPNARTTNMFPDDTFGVTNYYLPVYGAADDPTTAPPKLLLWFFDSRGGFLYNTTNATTGQQVGQPDWVAAEVAAWFTTAHAALTAQHNGTAIPSLAFVHIPVNASRALQSVGVDPQRQPGINDDVPLAAQAQGWCADGRNDGSCAYGGQDVPFMRALTSTPRLLALFSGHDHGDTWCYKWNAESLPGAEVKGNGINLCFGQHTGYGGYGNWVRGGRQVLLREADLVEDDDSIATWIRLETGDVVGSVQLNSTYGQDVYPVTPDTRTRCGSCDYSVVTPGPP